MLTKVESKRKPDRPCTTLLEGILQATGKRLGELKELLLNISRSHPYIPGVTRRRQQHYGASNKTLGSYCDSNYMKGVSR